MSAERAVERTSSSPAPNAVKKRHVVGVEVATPHADRRASEKENEAPPSTGRASKLKAQLQLDKQKADIALFQKEMTRKGGVVHGRKRHSEEAENDTGDGTDQEKPAGTQRQAKKVKTTAPVATQLPPVQYRMIVTGDNRWVNKVKKETEDTASPSRPPHAATPS